MAKKLKKISKKISNQFVLIVGDDGAILCHYMGNKLSSRIFVDNPMSEDVSLLQKLFASYPKHPVTILVDVIEQTYSQQVLPPVSSMGLVPQVQRRMKRDLRAEDLNNFMILGREKEGRKDWNVLFVSLANADPFAKWLEVVLNQPNKFNGVYLLPIESGILLKQLRAKVVDGENPEWEILLLHNKTGGFRIVAYKEDKLVFARLAQNLIGDNIPEVVVGNLEQEIQNTFEYLKRLGFKDEINSKLTIVASGEILEKVDSKVLKFGHVNLFTPSQISDLLELPEAVAAKDKYADIFAATFFAANKKHVLKFDTIYTKKLATLYIGVKGLLAFIAVAIIGGLSFEAMNVKDLADLKTQVSQAEANYKQQNFTYTQSQEKIKKATSADTEKIVSLYNLNSLVPNQKYTLLKILAKISADFGSDKILTSIDYSNGNKKTGRDEVVGGDAATQSKELTKYTTQAGKFTVALGVDFVVPEIKTSQIGEISEKYITTLKKYWPKAQISFSKPPQLRQDAQFETIAGEVETISRSVDVKIPSEIKISFESAEAL